MLVARRPVWFYDIHFGGSLVPIQIRAHYCHVLGANDQDPTGSRQSLKIHARMILVLFLLLRVVQSGEVSNQNQESDKV